MICAFLITFAHFLKKNVMGGVMMQRGMAGGMIMRGVDEDAGRGGGEGDHAGRGRERGSRREVRGRA